MPWGERPTGGLTALSRWRTRTGKSYKQLARDSGLTERTVTNAAAGKALSGGTIDALSKATGIPVAELVAQGRQA